MITIVLTLLILFAISSIIYTKYIQEYLIFYKNNKNQLKLLKQIKIRFSKVNVSELEAELKRITNEAQSIGENLSKIKKHIPLTKQTEDIVYLNSTSISDKLLESDETK